MAGPSLNLFRPKPHTEQRPTPQGKTGIAQQLFRYLLRHKIKQFKGIPGPTPSFPTGNTQDLSKGKPIWEVFADYAQQYGGLSLFWLLGRPCLVLNDPDLIAEVLMESTAGQTETKTTSKCPFHNFRFYKNLPRKALRPIMTDTSTFIAPVADQRWQELHQNHPFALDYFDQWLDTQFPTLRAFMQTRIAKLAAESATFEAFEMVQKLTFDGFSLAMVGKVFPDQVFAQFNTLCQSSTQRMNRSTIANGLIPNRPWDPRFHQVSRQWFKYFDQAVQQAQLQPTGESLMAWVMRKGGSNHTPDEFRNIFAGVYPGGAISAPSAITSTLHLLYQHPEVLASLRDALKDLFAAPLTLERLENCTLLDQVLREAMRLRPPVPFFMRNVNPDQPTKLGGHTIPANTSIFINNWYLHRSDHWSCPEAFKPERWDPETCRQNDWGSGYFFPYGRGKRTCMGQALAHCFMKLTLAVMVSECEVTFGDQPHDREFFFGVAVPRQLKVSLAPL
ncbi:cytochrome P450 [Acaryochloris sp. IP29b_bin.148]|uniref:cytochrome P450 n=1 Tax=Acaryochloris sp. IP29b_bin.148 TaxID=2969218 RepID=UPI00262B43B2|nr:cytochrome P450 [Acaryochloris sp. IP29b_bin.148]